MSQIPYHTLSRASAHWLGTIDTFVNEGKARHFPGSTTVLMDFSRRRLKLIPQMEERLVDQFKQAALLMADQVTEYLDEDLLYLISTYLKNWEFIVLTDSAGPTPRQPGEINSIRGFTRSIHLRRFYAAFALSVRGRQITKYELAATLFHELVHTADFDNLKLNFEEYRFEFEKAVDQGSRDPFIEAALEDEYELVPRAFQGSLFGSQGPVRNVKQFRSRVQGWRQRNSTVVRFVDRDSYKLFSQVRYELEGGRAVMTVAQQHVKQVRRREMEGDIRVCLDFPEGGLQLGPVKRGVLLWLREQAHQAESDPSREWDGFEAEWDQLLAGSHPDTHPELIIFGKEMDDFDPSKLEAPTGIINQVDFLAYADMKRERNRPRFDYPAWSQQLFAAYCGMKLDMFLVFVR